MSKLIVAQTVKGKGVFTSESVPKGGMISEWTGRLFSVYEMPHPYQSSADLFTQVGPLAYLGPSGGIDDLINHSCDPNCGLFFEGEHIYCKAVRNIHAGEEITWDYSTTMDEEGIRGLDGWEMKCRCGSVKCRGVIRGFNTVPPETQAEYIRVGIVPPYISDKYPLP